MKTCKECKWWGEPSFDEPSHHYCKKAEQIDDITYRVKDDGFGTQDGEPCNGGRFACGPNFGCVHFERKGSE